MSAFPLIPLRTLRQSLRLVWRGSRPWPLYYLIILVVQAILPLAGLYLTKLLVDSVVAQAGVVAPPFSEVAVYIGLLAAVWLLGSACRRSR
jgi:ATP-binding cassette subfamily B protein